jgi:hypothetical protein
MSRTFVRQDTQIRNSDAYVDTIAPTEAAYETNPTHIETDLNNIRSQIQNFLNRNGAGFPAGNWYGDLTAPSTLEAGTQRGLDAINDGLHAVEKKRVLRNVHSLVDVPVGGADNFVILGSSELPTQTTAAVGAVTTLGTVVAPHGGTFGTHSVTEVAGISAISPHNLMIIVDGASRDPILSSGRVVYGLLQGESGLTDGLVMTAVTTTRVQISFVRVNAAGDDLEAVPAGDIQGQTINYCSRERVRLEDLNEADFLGGAIVDVPAGSTVTRQIGYDSQGTTPVDLITNATLDLEGAGLTWLIRDDLEASLFGVVEGSAGGTSQVNIHADVDEFDVDALVNDFANGISVDTGAASTTLNLGVTANQIDSGGALSILSAAATDLTLFGQNEVIFNDGNMTSEGTWTGPGVKLSDTTAEVAAYETAFGGEVSLMNAITQAASGNNRDKCVAVVTTTASANTDVGGTGGGANLDAQLCDYSTVAFLDDVDVYLNGVLLRNGANAAANNDVYPGTSAALGQLRFEFSVKGTGANPDVITMIVYGV